MCSKPCSGGGGVCPHSGGPHGRLGVRGTPLLHGQTTAGGHGTFHLIATSCVFQNKTGRQLGERKGFLGDGRAIIQPNLFLLQRKKLRPREQKAVGLQAGGLPARAPASEQGALVLKATEAEKARHRILGNPANADYFCKNGLFVCSRGQRRERSLPPAALSEQLPAGA